MASEAASPKPPPASLMANTDLPARRIVEEAMRIAGDICIFTNDKTTVEEL